MIDLTFRAMTADDVPAGLALCRASRWNQVERDWRRFLTRSPEGAIVAMRDDRVVGTVATLPYGPFTWISMVLVEPSARGGGIGTELLARGLRAIPDGVCARLDATPAGRPIYEKLGFAGEYGLARWFREPSAAPAGEVHGNVRPVTAADWAAIEPQDCDVFGASRGWLLRDLAAAAPEYALAFERDGAIAGYLFGRHGHVRDHLGPLVADDTAAALALVEAALHHAGSRGVFLDVPDARTSWREALHRLGLAIERPFLRMHRGPLTSPGQPARIHAIAGPELG